MTAAPCAEVLQDPAAEAAGRLARVIERGGHIALSGGATPRAAYERLAGMALDFSRATLWFGDERCVPPQDEQSNFAMVRAALLDRLQGSGPVVRRIEGERDPRAAAASYEQLLGEVFGEGMPELDLALMGLGPDAHTASLFPGQEALDERERLAVAVEEPGMEPWVSRVTLTLPVFNAAREVVFLAAGADKADAVARAFSGEQHRDAPASLVSPGSGSLTLLLDEAAAAKLPGAVEVSRR